MDVPPVRLAALFSCIGHIQRRVVVAFVVEASAIHLNRTLCPRCTLRLFLLLRRSFFAKTKAEPSPCLHLLLLLLESLSFSKKLPIATKPEGEAASWFFLLRGGLKQREMASNGVTMALKLH